MLRFCTVKPVGFTIVELITVLVILGILSIGTVRFISDASTGFVSTAERADIAADVRSSINRLNRELREALPNSPRISGNCLEFIPLATASVYQSAPIGLSGTNLSVVPFDTSRLNTSSRIAIAPGVGLYTLANPGSMSPPFSAAVPDVNNLVNLTLNSSHLFPTNSPQRRFHIVNPPISYCVVNNALWRYENYGYQATQLTSSGLPSSMPTRSLLVERVDDSVTPFTINPATLTRNAVIDVALYYQRGDSQIDISHSIQMRNML